MYNNFKRIDIFGQDVRLLVKGQQTYRTSIGAIMTLILFAILAYSCNSFILEMNKGKNANLNQKEVILEDNEGFSFNSSQFVFAAGLLDNYGQPIPNTDERQIFSISFYFCNKSLNETNCDYIPSRICGNRIREVSLAMNVPESYENITYCMDEDYLKNNPQIRFQGSTRQDNFTLLGALIQKCANSSDSQSIYINVVDCAPIEEIDSYIKNANLYYSYSFFQFNKEMDGMPYEQVQSLDVTPLYQKVRKYIKIFYQYSQSTLEYNPFYFFPSYVLHDAIEYEYTLVDQNLNFDDDNSLAQVEINLDAKKKHQYITYQTLMDVAAKIGGFFTILKIAFDILLYPIQFIIYRLYLVNFLDQQQTHINSGNETPRGMLKKKITICQLICDTNLRQFYLDQSTTIEKLLDITQVLFNPLRLTRQVEDLYGSIRRFDAGGGGKFTTQNINQAIDELVANNDMIDLKSMSPRTINQEIKIGSLTNFKVPRLQVN